MQVASDGRATLYLGQKPVEHAIDVNAAYVMQILFDYAAAVQMPLIVTTKLPDGAWDRHRVDPDGKVTPVPRNTVVGVR